MEPFNFRHLDVDTNTRKYFFPTDLPLRPTQLNSTGREILLKVNQFRVTEWPQNTIYQYDVGRIQLNSFDIITDALP